ncbi:UNVERIFIED_ORG: hypothetical protein FHR35_003237 [Microbispora rosea subsp. rosea]
MGTILAESRHGEVNHATSLRDHEALAILFLEQLIEQVGEKETAPCRGP